MPIKDTKYITPDEWAKISEENPMRGMTGPRGKNWLPKSRKMKDLSEPISTEDVIAKNALKGRPSVTTFSGQWAGSEAYSFANKVRNRGGGQLRAIFGEDSLEGLPTITVGRRALSTS